MDKRYWKTIAAFLGLCAGALTIGALSASPAYAQWTNDDPAGVDECVAPSVNDAGTVVGSCNVDVFEEGFVRLPRASSSTVLAPLTILPCEVLGITNAAAGNETIVGSCVDANFDMQGVFWRSAGPSTTPTLLQPLSLLDLLPDVLTEATAFNTSGVIVGISIDGDGDETPVSWSSTGYPTALAPPLLPLLSENTGCEPAAINDARTPSIIANCGEYNADGGDQAVLWQGVTSAYTVLPVPTGADYCSVSAVNLVGQILGLCFYGSDVDRVTVWGAGGTGPTVLMTVGRATVSRTFDVGINDSGMVACNYLAGGASADFKEPCSWNPSGGNTDAVAISAPAGATGPTTNVAIGNNGKFVGLWETAGGLLHPFHVEPASTAAVDDGSPAGGPNTNAVSMSKGGVNEAVEAQNSSEVTQDEEQPTP
jgi:hypothetical protein